VIAADADAQLLPINQPAITTGHANLYGEAGIRMKGKGTFLAKPDGKDMKQYDLGHLDCCEDTEQTSA
jgi:hypothetical protein